MNYVNLTIRLDDNMRQQLIKLADADNRSTSSLVRILLTEALAAREGKK